MYKYSWHQAAWETVSMQVAGNGGNLSNLSAYFTDSETEIHTRDKTYACTFIPRENNFSKISIFLNHKKNIWWKKNNSLNKHFCFSYGNNTHEGICICQAVSSYYIQKVEVFD